MNTLHIPINKEWFDMIASGEKKEEYREMKPYWEKRLIERRYEEIEFRNGYGKSVPSITVRYEGLCIGRGNTEWGAPNKCVFIIKLGAILRVRNHER